MRMKISKEELLNIIKTDIDNAEQYAESVIYPKVKEAIELYKATHEYYLELMPKLSERSKFTSTDIADAVEAVMASLMKIFFGTDDVISVAGRTKEDDAKAEKMQALCNYQINRLNDGYVEFYKWFKEALISGFAVMKLGWDRRYRKDTYKDFISIDQLQAMKLDNNIEIKSIEPVVTYDQFGMPSELYEVSYTLQTIEKNQPIFNCLPYTEFLFDPEAKDQSEMTFAIHRKNVTADYLRKRADMGIYKNVEEAIARAEQDKELDGFEKTYESADKSKQKITIYEYYGEVDINGDGRLEKIICTVAGDTILLLQENTFERIPFVILSPILETNNIVGKGFADLLGQLQNLKTMLIKELAYNIAQSNDNRLFVNTDFVNLHDYLEGRKIIRTTGNIPLQQIVAPVPFENIHPATMSMLEYIDTIKENRSGVTRYNQGLDARSLNKTATGINMIMNAANQRIELIARIFAETGIRRFMEMLVEFNLKFIDQEQIIRLTNEPMPITPDDLDGKFDLIVNTGIAGAQKQEQMGYLQQMLQISMQVLMPMQLITPDKIYNIIKKMYEIMGFKNVDDFVNNPRMQGAMNGLGQLNQGQLTGDTLGGAVGAPQDLTGGMQGADLQTVAAILNGGMGAPQGDAGGGQNA